MLTQVVGRAGRGDCEGRALIQTLTPNNAIIQLAAKQDYDSFYELEIGLRRVQDLPPFGDQILVAFQGEQEQQVLLGAMKFRDSLLELQRSWALGPLTVLGPAPSPVPKVNYRYRYRLTVLGKMTKELRSGLSYLLRSFGKDSKMRGVTAFIDVNGFE